MLVACLRMSAGNFNVAWSKYPSSAVSSFMALTNYHGVPSGVMPLVHPAWVLFPLAAKLSDFVVATNCGVTNMLLLCGLPTMDFIRRRRICPSASVVPPSMSMSRYTPGVVKVSLSACPQHAWRIFFLGHHELGVLIPVFCRQGLRRCGVEYDHVCVGSR